MRAAAVGGGDEEEQWWERSRFLKTKHFTIRKTKNWDYQKKQKNKRCEDL